MTSNDINYVGTLMFSRKGDLLSRRFLLFSDNEKELDKNMHQYRDKMMNDGYIFLYSMRQEVGEYMENGIDNDYYKNIILH